MACRQSMSSHTLPSGNILVKKRHHWPSSPNTLRTYTQHQGVLERLATRLEKLKINPSVESLPVAVAYCCTLFRVAGPEYTRRAARQLGYVVSVFPAGLTDHW